jgi:hypothetical protein
MEGTCGAGDCVGRPEGVKPRKLPAPTGMPVPVGVEHWKAPERLPDAARTPWKLRISRRSAGFRAGETPWGAEFEASWFAQTRRTQACEGTSGSESSCDRPGMMCFEGGSEALEPRPWNQNWRAQVPWSPQSFQTSYSSEFEAAKHCGQEGAAGAAMHHGLPFRKSVPSENPMSGSGPSVSARPEGEQTVEGARNPEDGRCRTGRSDMTIPPLMSLKGRETPGGATRSTQDRGGRLGPNPERATKPAGAAGRSQDRTDGRTAEFLVVVQTTRRRRRTNRAATPDGALREAGQP